MKSVSKSLWVVLTFALLSCIFFWKFIVCGQVPIAADILEAYYPWKEEVILNTRIHNEYLWDNIFYYFPVKHFISERLKSGEIPLWNPMGLCGNPFPASGDSALFYPFNLLFSIMPVTTAFAIFDLLHIFMAGLFMRIFLRAIGCNQFGAFIGGVVFMFNGFLIVWMEHANILSSIIWLPIILTLTEQVIKTNRYLWVFLCGISIGVQFLAGFPQVSFYILIAVGIYVLVRVLQLQNDIKKRSLSIGLVGLAIIIGFGIGAVQLLPLTELAVVSQRPRGNWLLFPLINPAVLLHVVTFVMPDAFGNPVDYNYWGAVNYVELCGYIGMIPLLLGFSMIPEWRNRQVLPFLILAIFAILVYLRTPLERLLYVIPGYSHGLSASRTICLYTFAGSVLAGMGAHCLIEPSSRREIILRLRSVAGYMLLIILVGLFIWNFFLTAERGNIINHTPVAVEPVLRTEPDLKIVVIDFFNTACSSWAFFSNYYRVNSPAVYKPVLLLLSFFLLVTISLRWKIQTIWLKLLLTFLIVFDLFYFGIKFITFVKPEAVYPEVNAATFLEKDKGIWRAMSIGPTFQSYSLMVYGIQDVNGNESLFQKRYEELACAVDRNAVIYPGHMGVQLSDYRSKLIDLLNVKYIITKEPISSDAERFSLVYDQDVKIYQNSKVIPRAFIVSQAKVIQDDSRIISELVKPDFDLQNCVILEEHPEENIAFRDTTGSTVSITSYTANSVTLDAEMTGNAFLVLTDAYYPGWKAYIDGRQTKIYRGNYIFRVIEVPDGEHKIEFIYSPLSLKIGAVTTIFVLGCSAFLMGVMERRGFGEKMSGIAANE